MGCIMLLGEGCVMNAATTIIRDTFADNVELNGRLAAPVNVPGSHWVVDPGIPGGLDAQIVGFGAGTQLQAGVTSAQGQIDCQHSSGTVQCGVSTGNNNDIQVVFRSDAPSDNFWQASWDVVAQTFSLQKLVGGVFTGNVASTSVNLSLGTHTIKVILNGNSIVATIDGAHQISAIDSDLAGNTFMGFAAGNSDSNSNGETFTNFKFTVP